MRQAADKICSTKVYLIMKSGNCSNKARNQSFQELLELSGRHWKFAGLKVLVVNNCWLLLTESRLVVTWQVPGVPASERLLLVDALHSCSRGRDMVTSLASPTTHLLTVATVTTFTLVWRLGTWQMRNYKSDQSTESYNLVWLVLRFCHATHSTATASPSPILVLAVLDENTKTEMLLSCGWLASIPSSWVNWEPFMLMKIKFLSPIYLRQNSNPTQPNTIDCKIIGSCLFVGRNWSSEFILLLSGASQCLNLCGYSLLVTFNKHIKLAGASADCNKHSLTHSTASAQLY